MSNRSRVLVRILGLLSLGLAACQSEPDFATLQPQYFGALSVFDDAARMGQPAFEARLAQLADALIARLDRGEITSQADRETTARALTYAGFFLVAEKQEVEDGYLNSADVLQPPRYAKQGGDREESLARLQRMSDLLGRATRLWPTYTPPPAMHRAVVYDLEEVQEGVSQASYDALIDWAARDTFSTFTALALFRDGNQHPMDKPYMQRLFDAICSPQRFDCDRMGPPAVDPMDERTLTRKVNGPVWLGDLFLRRAESLVHSADRDPATAMPKLMEAQGRTQAAAGVLLSAQLEAQKDEFAVYPARDSFDPRQERIDQVRAAIAARLAGRPAPAALPDGRDYYKARAYRAVYQCTACHMPRPNLPDSFHGVPR